MKQYSKMLFSSDSVWLANTITTYSSSLKNIQHIVKLPNDIY